MVRIGWHAITDLAPCRRGPKASLDGGELFCAVPLDEHEMTIDLAVDQVVRCGLLRRHDALRRCPRVTSTGRPSRNAEARIGQIRPSGMVYSRMSMLPM